MINILFNSNRFVYFIIRWGILIYGGIDGFSRFVVFLKVDIDNRVLIVL